MGQRGSLIKVLKDGAEPMWRKRKDPTTLTVAPLSYDFRGGPGVEVKIGMFLTCVCTFGLGVPWAQVMRYRWIAENTYVNGQPLQFTGTGGQLCRQYIKWWLLCFPTFGIYAFFIPSRIQKWAIKNQNGQIPVPLS